MHKAAIYFIFVSSGHMVYPSRVQLVIQTFATILVNCAPS